MYRERVARSGEVVERCRLVFSMLVVRGLGCVLAVPDS
jgi:hypothetical protein